MSLKKNILANYASQIYVTLIGIALVPLYVQYLGAEAYGLVGFFSLLQSLFGLLDLGLRPTIARETARFSGGAMTALVYRQLYRAISIIFSAVAIVGAGILLCLNDVLVNNWLTTNQLSDNDVSFAVLIMALSVPLRWMCALYRGAINGFERLIWLNSYNAIIATLRFVAVFPSMWLFGYTPCVFFAHQLVVAILEILILFLKTHSLLPTVGFNESIGWSFKPVVPMLRFALSISVTSSVWILVSQTDKFVLSGILPLAEYGYFTLAVMVANGIMVISSPVSGAIMPRMVRLFAEQNYEGMIRIYRKSTQLVSIIAGSATVTLVSCSFPILYAWSGNTELANNSSPVMQLYAIGYGLLAISAYPYYLQYAKGSLRYHLYGNIIMVLLLIPGVIYAATKYGAVGAGYVWLGVNAIYLLAWVAYVHKKIEPGLHVKWMLNDFLYVVIPAILLGFVVSYYDFHHESRIVNMFYSSIVGLAALLLSSFASHDVRNVMKSVFAKYYK